MLEFKVKPYLIVFSYVLSPVVLEVYSNLTVEIFYLLFKYPVIFFPEKFGIKSGYLQEVLRCLISFCTMVLGKHIFEVNFIRQQAAEIFEELEYGNMLEQFVTYIFNFVILFFFCPFN